MTGASTYWCELAWLGGEQAATGVVLEVADDRIAAVTAGVAKPPSAAVRLAGLTLPGLANAHSHTFQRALRGRTQAGTGSFWTWRKQMYRVTDRLTPDTCHRLARATFAEMALAGVAVVGEFHYVHHRPDGRPYDEPNAMGEALLGAAADAGIRITLLDTCYLHGGLAADGYQAPDPSQQRFSDGSAEKWAERLDALQAGPTSRVGAAVHSVRAVDPAAMKAVAGWAAAHDAPVHVHLSEQPAENEQCLAHHGCTPARLLADCGLLTDRLTAVHATHLTDDDIGLLGGTGTAICLCPTTERDLADGIGPSSSLRSAGSPLCLGSDSHAVIDLFEEARVVELDERLATLVRGSHAAPVLAAMATLNGYRCLGWADGGVLTSGALADFATVGLDSARMAGTDPATALAATVFAGTGADVNHLVVGGEVVVADGVHLSIDVVAELAASIAEVVGL